jgi:hypothetical protein
VLQTKKMMMQTKMMMLQDISLRTLLTENICNSHCKAGIANPSDKTRSRLALCLNRIAKTLTTTDTIGRMATTPCSVSPPRM